MSLINKMLQDLDARGSQAGSALQSEIKPVMLPDRRLPLMQIVLGATVVVIAMAIAAYFWLKGRAPGPVSDAPAVLTAAAPKAPNPVAAPVPATVAEPLVARQIPYVPPGEKAAAAPAAVPAAAPNPVAEKPPAAAARAVATAPAQPALEKLPSPAPRALPAPREIGEAPVPEVQRPATAAQAGVGREMTVAQRAESQYRAAMTALDQGRVSAALDGLEAALKLNPRHDAARQSLVALLIEAGRNDEAMQQLEQGLAVDASQPALAMLLARMQIERGTSGVATLMRTLPAAQGNADYHAFLAGVLQRENRHREAVEQYGAALRRVPDQGVWLMGLGISLQAEKRDAEALAAFQKAKMSGMLTPQLTTFVQGKIQQLQ